MKRKEKKTNILGCIIYRNIVENFGFCFLLIQGHEYRTLELDLW